QASINTINFSTIKITLKIKKYTKTFPYQHYRHSFCAFPSSQKIPPNKLNHLPHQLQGRQQIKQGVT
ncbi:TPA: hypothetical protein ACIVZI_003570, partial [Salmonella enterica subsp. enterica serovar Montevideo]